jgi:hypothetical protein
LPLVPLLALLLLLLLLLLLHCFQPAPPRQPHPLLLACSAVHLRHCDMLSAIVYF